MDQISEFLSDLPIGFIIFAIAMLFGLFGRDDKKQAGAPTQRRMQQSSAPNAPSTFASDERRDREERARERSTEFGGVEFGSSDDMFRGSTEWGQTKYGFDDSEWGSDAQWGSSFGEKKDSEPVIR